MARLLVRLAAASVIALPACTGGYGGETGAGGGDAGSAFVPAAHPAAPQVRTLGGPVLAKPKVQAIAYATDPGLADVEAFLEELTKTSYWSATTAEYGVGALTILPTITLTAPPPAMTTDAALRASLTANTTGAKPAWGAADASTIYLFVIPEGTKVENGTAPSCTDFDAYHNEATAGSVRVPFAVSCVCPGFDGASITALEGRTINISHELIEAATNPFSRSDPAFSRADDADLFWSFATGGELADMCQFNVDAYVVPAGGKYMVQRSWSNAAAKATENPCVPSDLAKPYFNSFPALSMVPWVADGKAVETRGVQIPVGRSKTIDVDLFSTAATASSWTVKAYDFASAVQGSAANLTFGFDKTSGENGDVLHLTLASKSVDASIHGAGFFLVSDLGQPGDPGFTETITVGLVVP